MISIHLSIYFIHSKLPYIDPFIHPYIMSHWLSPSDAFRETTEKQQINFYFIHPSFQPVIHPSIYSNLPSVYLYTHLSFHFTAFNYFMLPYTGSKACILVYSHRCTSHPIYTTPSFIRVIFWYISNWTGKIPLFILRVF